MAKKHQTILNKIIKNTSSLPRLLTVLVISLLVVGGAYGYKYGHRYYDDHYSKTEPVAKVKSGVKSGGTANFTIASGTPTTQSTTSSSSTQPAQTTTPSTPATTTTPKSSTPTTYPSVIDGVIWASSSCHYEPGDGEAYWRNYLVQYIQSYQISVANYWSGLLNQSSQNPSLMTDQQLLNDINQYITVANSGIMSTYGQYVNNVNSIGCTETIEAAQIPQIQACTDINGCSDNIFGISIPSLE